MRTDYRKWIIYEAELKTEQDFIELHAAAKEMTTKGQCIVSELIIEGKKVVSIARGNQTIELDEVIRQEFITYLEKNYLNSEIEGDNNFAGENPIKPTDGMPEVTSEQKRWKPFFINSNILKHVLGYSIIGFASSQFFVLPQYFGVKLVSFLTWIHIFISATLAFFAVSIYKKHFLIGGIRYETVRKITLTLYGITFTAVSFEVTLLDLLFRQNENGLFGAVGLLIVMILAGLLSGWIISFFIYFLNGGKIITDPSKISVRS